MINYFFHDSAGKIVMTGACQEYELERQSFPGATLVIGAADLRSQYYKNDTLRNFPEKPGDNYIFDFNLEKWVFDNEIAIDAALQKRNELLKNGPDRVNSMWWASMTAAQQSDVTTYRQALLDITNQFGFPMDIEWPEIPSVFKG